MEEKKLLKNLLSDNPELRKTATHALWDIWLRQAGEKAEFRIRKGAKQMDMGQYVLAQKEFKNLTMDYPEFAEAHNKLATVLYLQRKYKESIKECETTLKMNTNHFGAWNGLGLCYYQLANYPRAIQSFKTALAIQPFADSNKVYIARCRGQLN